MITKEMLEAAAAMAVLNGGRPDTVLLPRSLYNMAKGPTEMEKQLQDLEKIAPDICRKLKNRLGENTWRRLGYGCPERHVVKFKKCFAESMKAWVEQDAPGRVAEYDLECLFPESGDPSRVDRFALARKMVGK